MACALSGRSDGKCFIQTAANFMHIKGEGNIKFATDHAGHCGSCKLASLPQPHCLAALAHKGHLQASPLQRRHRSKSKGKNELNMT